MPTNLLSDAGTRKTFEAFFVAAGNHRIDSTDIGAAFKAGNCAMYHSVLYRTSAVLTKARQDLERAVLSKLGAHHTNEVTVGRLAWQVASTSDTPAEKCKIFAKSIELDASTQYVTLLPCYAVQLDGLRRLTIGDVVIEPTRLTAGRVNRVDRRISIAFPQDHSVTLKDGKFLIGMPETVWHVSVGCTLDNVQEEALWLIDIARSLLRLSIPSAKRKSRFPRFGRVEASACEQRTLGHRGLSVTRNNATFSRGRAPGVYEIDRSTFTATQRRNLNKVASELMRPKENSLAERFARGLGWLSRGRSSDDRAERFLYFFTALEALLTRDDKNAPVVDTICRNTACIIAASVADRASVAKKLSTLYSLRSKLIHGGDRRMSHGETAELQRETELVFYAVLRKVDLRMEAEKFHQTLKEAGYGTPWPR